VRLKVKTAITTEIELPHDIPGQALSHKIGQLKIMELRKERKQNGAKLTSKKFHEKCESGAMPLALLEKKN
jgi:uncharacterized protein (DUF885 family)